MAQRLSRRSASPPHHPRHKQGRRTPVVPTVLSLPTSAVPPVPRQLPDFNAEHVTLTTVSVSRHGMTTPPNSQPPWLPVGLRTLNVPADNSSHRGVHGKHGALARWPAGPLLQNSNGDQAPTDRACGRGPATSDQLATREPQVAAARDVRGTRALRRSSGLRESSPSAGRRTASVLRNSLLPL